MGNSEGGMWIAVSRRKSAICLLMVPNTECKILIMDCKLSWRLIYRNQGKEPRVKIQL
jgi:hypothetical protein